MSGYGAEFDRLARRWAYIENEHDHLHPDRGECGGVGGCEVMFVAVGLEQEMVDALREWRRRGDAPGTVPVATATATAQPAAPTEPLIHLAECEPEQHDGWRKMPYRDALAACGQMCPDTRYMTNEIFPDEPVWVEDNAERRS